MLKHPIIESLGCEALIIRFGDQIDPKITPRLRALSEEINALEINGLLDQVPAYTTLTLHFDARRISYGDLQKQIRPLLTTSSESLSDNGKKIVIPVWYDPEVGMDLQRIADYHHISIDEVIKRHSQQTYQVYAIGFAPGFAYLGEVAANLVTPRLKTPRSHVPAGSVAIADEQTAVYPLSTPGGWNIVGRTTMSMFDQHQPGLSPLKIGDEVLFQPVSRSEFIRAGGRSDE